MTLFTYNGKIILTNLTQKGDTKMNDISELKSIFENIEGDGICIALNDSIIYFNEKMQKINDSIALNQNINSFYCQDIGIYFSLKENKRYHTKKITLGENKILYIFSENKEEKRGKVFQQKEFCKIVHDLRSPLNTILLLSQNSSLSKINSCAEYMLELINSLLKNAKADYNNSFYLKDTVKQVFEMCEELARNKGQSLKLTLPERNFCFLGDSLKLRQLIFNLTANAVKYTKIGGSISLNIIVEPLKNNAKSKEYLLKAIIKDSGIGISQNQLEKIFNAYDNLEENKSSELNSFNENNSTGLGLYIVKEIAQNLGGDISVESKIGIGSSFTLSLPFKAS